MARKEEIRTADVHEWDRPFSQAIAHGDTLYLSGQVGADRDGNIVEGGIREQAAQIFDNVEAVLSAAGSSLDDVLKATVFLTDIDDYDAFNEVYRDRMPAPLPARSAVEVADIAVDAKVEMEIIAAR